MGCDIPKHVAVVMDGNGRWASKRGLPRCEGHRAGSESVHRAIEFAVKKKIEILTLFALSVENLKIRPLKEIKFLLVLLQESLFQSTEELHKKNIRILIIGDRSPFPDSLLKQIKQSEKLTARNTGLTLVLAINYSGRWDILHAVRKVCEQVQEGHLVPSELDDSIFRNFFSLGKLCDPDLCIRTSGEMRISNFMLWQFAYTEFYFSESFWPDFDATIFQCAIDAFAKRERRFGQIGA